MVGRRLKIEAELAVPLILSSSYRFHIRYHIIGHYHDHDKHDGGKAVPKYCRHIIVFIFSKHDDDDNLPSPNV